MSLATLPMYLPPLHVLLYPHPGLAAGQQHYGLIMTLFTLLVCSSRIQLSLSLVPKPYEFIWSCLGRSGFQQWKRKACIPTCDICIDYRQFWALCHIRVGCFTLHAIACAWLTSYSSFFEVIGILEPPTLQAEDPAGKHKNHYCVGALTHAY